MNLPDPKDVRRVATIGAGTIGASWAAYFLARGMDVRVWDPAPDSDTRVRAYVDGVWPALERLGLAETADRQRLEVHADLEAALQGAQFVQESAPERKPIKIELYEQFDRLLPDDTVMSTSSSGLLLSELQANRVGRERYVLGHPFNPPHLIPLVEVLGGRDTDPAAVDWTLAFYNAHGKKAVRLNKEVPGHLVNRLQAAIWREAIDAVVSGLASVEDVDTAIAYGPGLRWAVMGPLQLCQLAGGPGGMPDFLDHFGPPLEDWWADMRNVVLSEDVKTALMEGVEAENHGLSVPEVAQERDRLLLDLLETLARARRK
ncbi:MAG: 3-hydroxyacyl-CoA dehydrogenase NAD-binding domain-containing protein [Gammaproteobacteria bacterium]|nr:3-hydroxyacyl-CoA dehydrogenase NAD-binding domain-containing protein [Gammaproteobacteria bacterium]